MAGCAHIQNGQVDIPVPGQIQDFRNQIAGVQGAGFPRLQIDRHAPLRLCPQDAALQPGNIVVRPRDMMPAAEIQPLHARQQIAEPLRYRIQGGLQGIGVLLAQGVKMQAVQQSRQSRRHLRIPLGSRGSQAAARGAGIIDLVPLLGGAFRIDPQSDALSGFLGHGAEFLQLSGRIEHNMVGIPQQLPEFRFAICGAEDMGFFPGHFFLPQAGLIQSAGFRTGQIRLQNRVQVIVGKRLLGQKNLSPGSSRYAGQNFAVADQLRLIQHIGRRGDCGKKRLGIPTDKAQKRRTMLLRLHQSTRTGA